MKNLKDIILVIIYVLFMCAILYASFQTDKSNLQSSEYQDVRKQIEYESMITGW